MARKPRPGRTLVVFFLSTVLLYGLVALAGSWKPELGLDLQGGTRITLIAKGNPTTESLAEARGIIDQRVNGSGVTEAEVSTQGDRFIIVEIPGATRDDLVETVKRQAQLRFRLVACTSLDPTCGGAPTGQPGPGQPEVVIPGTGGEDGQQQDGGQQGGNKGDKGGQDQSGNNRPPVGFAEKDLAAPTASPSPTADESGEGEPEPSDDPTETTSTDASEDPTESPSGVVAPDAGDGGELADKPLEWMNNPDAASVEAFSSFQCPTDGSPVITEDDPDKPLITCGTEESAGIKYLLSPVLIEGTALKDVAAAIPPQDVSWIVQLSFDGPGTDEFAKISRALYGTPDQFAIVLDGQVISAPTMNGLILNGEAQISGDFTEAQAQSLATSLKFGALPVAFEDDPSVETIGPSLAGNQLEAGIFAGILGLALVMIYCLFYYRGLGLVVIASLFVAAAITYAIVLLLSETAGFTLSLPGIAGLIIAVGITADSFIVFFERIRDEMRDGKSMRVAVESGWARARNTCLAADAVSLLAAVVLYIFAAGVVKGFAFALGVSTLIDLVVFFWFTHPMVSWLGRFRFFNRGHKLSGLDAGALGVDRLPSGGVA